MIIPQQSTTAAVMEGAIGILRKGTIVTKHVKHNNVLQFKMGCKKGDNFAVQKQMMGVVADFFLHL